MATDGDGGKRTWTLLTYDFVKKRKFDEEKMRMIEAGIGVRCASCFVGAPPTLVVTPDILILFENPVLH